MANVIRWNPYEELQRMREDFGRIFGPAMQREDEWGPSVDVRETESGYVVTAEVPGIDPDDLEVTLTEDGLSLRGEFKERADTDEKGVHRRERRFGSFQRTVGFPSPVRHDQAKAECRNGVLEIDVPKASPDRGASTRLKITGH